MTHILTYNPIFATLPELNIKQQHTHTLYKKQNQPSLAKIHKSYTRHNKNYPSPKGKYIFIYTIRNTNTCHTQNNSARY
jgi:hypothetical protein